MAAIDLYGQAERAEIVREKKLHPSCYLLTGLGVLVVIALALDFLVGVLLR